MDAAQALDLLVRNALPALLLLAFLSVLFGFIKRMTSNVSLAVIVLLIAGGMVAPLVAQAVAASAYVDVSGSGWVAVQGAYEVYDAYGAKVQADYGDYLGVTWTMWQAQPGRYYLVELPQAPQQTLDLVDVDSSDATISWDPQRRMTKIVGLSSNGASITVDEPVVITAYLVSTSYGIEVYDSNGTRIWVGMAVGWNEYTLPAAGTYTVKMYQRTYNPTTGTYQTTYIVPEFYVKALDVDLAARPQPRPITVNPVSISSATSTVRVYAHKATIDAQSHFMNVFVVPVDSSEVSGLLPEGFSLAVLYIDQASGSQTAMPAVLVRFGGQEFVVFRSWVDASGPVDYYIVWNWPQVLPLNPLTEGVFIEKLDGDPLLVWQEQLNSNALAQYDAVNRKLVVASADGVNVAEYALARALGFQPSMVLAFGSGLASGIGGYPSGVAFPGPSAVDAAGNYYQLSIAASASNIQLSFTQQQVLQQPGGQSVAVYFSANPSSQAEWLGLVAADKMTAYNATFNKQLLRLDVQVETSRIYSVGQAPGYWRYSVPVSIVFDPTAVPASVSEVVVRIMLPEREWVGQGVATPGLADIAVVDSQGRLLKFWLEPYQQADGSRGLWVRLPIDRARSIYGVYIYLVNPDLGSPLSTPEAFDVYYDKALGPGATWSQDSEGFLVVSHAYSNVVVFLPEQGYEVKLGLTPLDYYLVSATGLEEVHSSYRTVLATISGALTLDNVHVVAWAGDGRMRYQVGSTTVLEVSGLRKDYAWPLIVKGHKNVAFFASAYMPEAYSYSIGSVFGGSWGWPDSEASASQTEALDWRALLPLMLVMLGMAIFIRIVEGGIPIRVSQKRGLF